MFEYNILVVADDGFGNTCKDLSSYQQKLSEVMKNRAGEQTLCTSSVTGKFSYPSEKLIEVNDKNKTNFIKSLNEVLEQFNEVIMLTNYQNDPYMLALTNRLQELSVQFTVYGYETVK